MLYYRSELRCLKHDLELKSMIKNCVKISLIICTYNRDQYLYDTLKHIALNDYSFSDYEVVLINNNSTDRTEYECRRFQQDFPQVIFRYFVEKNQGLSYARNRGVAEAKGEVLVFLDDDAFVRIDYLKNLTKNLLKYPDLIAFGGKITPRFETGIEPKWFSKWTYSWVSGIDLGNEARLFKGTEYPVGANMGVVRSVFYKMAGFNTQLGRSAKNLMGGEEYDFFNSIKETGASIYYFPDIEVEHIIPENRTTIEYIKRLALGNGVSERMRTLNISKYKFFKRLVFEVIQWVASLVVFFRYLIVFKPEKGAVLVLRRWYVTKGLLMRQQTV